MYEALVIKIKITGRLAGVKNVQQSANYILYHDCRILSRYYITVKSYHNS